MRCEVLDERCEDCIGCRCDLWDISEAQATGCTRANELPRSIQLLQQRVQPRCKQRCSCSQRPANEPVLNCAVLPGMGCKQDKSENTRMQVGKSPAFTPQGKSSGKSWKGSGLWERANDVCKTRKSLCGKKRIKTK